MITSSRWFRRRHNTIRGRLGLSSWRARDRIRIVTALSFTLPFRLRLGTLEALRSFPTIVVLKNILMLVILIIVTFPFPVITFLAFLGFLSFLRLRTPPRWTRIFIRWRSWLGHVRWIGPRCWCRFLRCRSLCALGSFCGTYTWW